MAKHLPAQTPPVRVIHYVDPATRTGADLRNVPPAVLALALADAMGRQHRQRLDRREQYAAWQRRQDEIRRHDRKVRRVLIVAVPTTLGLLAAGGWLLAEMTVAAISTGAVLGAAGVLVVLAALVGTVGRRCITVVQHWHE
ncbi:hypothetical protein Daura_43525 [Dactylosporangium aurantiacum]|uniref:Uncharacterized protein n=1 Tax=Dactylosporangium aurantiacum TaxID=35754 RepID=A0A9Q9IHP8_9ACTN|nr:hypothetical protein [Dactylosporangium aurantiacum]MDG6102348.1 hypothetical protein [Dactylosporangium aurantiacum]UWZ53353.1 hypothetical protein Daura_43525 [Dactylosporangium aurantiacum]